MRVNRPTYYCELVSRHRDFETGRFVKEIIPMELENDGMLVVVDRFKQVGWDPILKTPTTTISRISVDGEFICHGLEDAGREVKIKHKTRIWVGEYEIGLHPKSRFMASMLRAFGNEHAKGMLHILDVKGFTWILIHPGNTHNDTSGCLLPGHWSGGETVSPSRPNYWKLYKLIIAAINRGEKVTIRFEDNDV